MIYSEASRNIKQTLQNELNSCQVLSSEVLNHECVQAKLNSTQKVNECLSQYQQAKKLKVKGPQVFNKEQHNFQVKSRKCHSCQAWEEWALQSQQTILLIEKKMIERQQILHQKFKIMKLQIQKQKINYSQIHQKYDEKKIRDQQLIQKLDKTVSQLKMKLKSFQISQKFTKSSKNIQKFEVLIPDEAEKQVKKQSNLNKSKISYSQLNLNNEIQQKQLVFQNQKSKKQQQNYEILNKNATNINKFSLHETNFIQGPQMLSRQSKMYSKDKRFSTEAQEKKMIKNVIHYTENIQQSLESVPTLQSQYFQNSREIRKMTPPIPKYISIKQQSGKISKSLHMQSKSNLNKSSNDAFTEIDSRMCQQVYELKLDQNYQNNQRIQSSLSSLSSQSQRQSDIYIKGTKLQINKKQEVQSISNLQSSHYLNKKQQKSVNYSKIDSKITQKLMPLQNTKVFAQYKQNKQIKKNQFQSLVLQESERKRAIQHNINSYGRNNIQIEDKKSPSIFGINKTYQEFYNSNKISLSSRALSHQNLFGDQIVKDKNSSVFKKINRVQEQTAQIISVKTQSEPSVGKIQSQKVLRSNINNKIQNKDDQKIIYCQNSSSYENTQNSKYLNYTIKNSSRNMGKQTTQELQIKTNTNKQHKNFSFSQSVQSQKNIEQKKLNIYPTENITCKNNWYLNDQNTITNKHNKLNILNSIQNSKNTSSNNSSSNIKPNCSSEINSGFNSGACMQDTNKSLPYAQNTYKTIKLANHNLNVEKSRVYNQSITDCSCIHDIRSRNSHASYYQQEIGCRIPTDQPITIYDDNSECVNKHNGQGYNNFKSNINAKNRLSNQMNGRENKERNQGYQNLHVKKNQEQMKKLQFQNQNLKSYNRVLLEKLSNSRPRKY